MRNCRIECGKVSWNTFGFFLGINFIQFCNIWEWILFHPKICVKKHIYIYAITKTMRPRGYRYNGFVATHALGHMTYTYNHLYIYIGRASGLSTLCHSCGFASQQTVLKTFSGPGYFRSEDGVVWLSMVFTGKW